MLLSQRKPLATWLLNSTLVMIGATAISLSIATLAGYSLSRFRTRAQEITGLTLLLTKMLPGSLIVIPFFIMASTFHLIDSLWALMFANAAVGVPFATWLLKGFFDGIPRDLEHAAMIDGCGHLGALWHVILPLARPGLAACAIYLAILSWSDFVFARTLINDQARWTVTTGLVSFIGEHCDRLAGPDGRRRAVDGADGGPVPSARTVPRVGAHHRVAALICASS